MRAVTSSTPRGSSSRGARPSDVEAHRELLAILAATGDRAALAAQARRVLEVDPDDAFATALSAGRLPYRVASETAEAVAAAGLERIHRREWLEAAVLYRRALELDERSGAAWNNLGWALASAGFDDLAIPCFERALAVDPGQTNARSNLDWVRARRDAQGASPP